MPPHDGFLALSPREVRLFDAVFARMFPTDASSAGAREIGAIHFLDQSLAGAYYEHRESYRQAALALDAAATSRWGRSFADGTESQQDSLISDLQHGRIEGWASPPQMPFFAMMRQHLLEGLFSDPIYGGNIDKLGWKTIGHPGVWLENSAEEQLQETPVTKGGKIQSLADIGYALGKQKVALEVPGYDPQRGAAPAAKKADVVLVGVGGVGGVIAPILCKAGLKVVGLEAGPYWLPEEFTPDELGSTYYSRAQMGQKFLSEQPRWRTADGEPTQELTYSLGRMMNGVGGSVIHYGAWLRRFHPHHMRLRSYAEERWGKNCFPEDCTTIDWAVSYDELEPYFCEAEWMAAVTRADNNPFPPRSKDAPMPPMRPFRMGEIFRKATEDMGYHPHMVPIGMNTQPFEGFPETTYCAWNNGFGSWTGDKWHPGLTSVPEALATRNFDLRTRCRVTRVITNAEGRATGVEYIDALGKRQIQEADTVILAAYTFENVRLMFLSADGKHPNGVGNSTGQLGKHYMVKMFTHVDGFCPDIIFNRHTGPAAQAMVMDDLVSDQFDSFAHGFVGGGTLGAENQFLPLQIARESLPADVPSWGAGYKKHLLEWQHIGVVRCQPDALSYNANYLDLDPDYRDRSGVGDPVLRITYELKPNELKQAAYFGTKSEEILHAMGATKTWQGPYFTGAGSSHDLGGTRFGDDPNINVLNRDLRVHDTPGLYVMSGSALPTCAGINPTLSIWALCLHATHALAKRLANGDER